MLDILLRIWHQHSPKTFLNLIQKEVCPLNWPEFSRREVKKQYIKSIPTADIFEVAKLKIYTTKSQTTMTKLYGTHKYIMDHD